MCIQYDLFGVFFFQAEDGIRDAQESRGLGDVYKRQLPALIAGLPSSNAWVAVGPPLSANGPSSGSVSMLSLIHI